MNVKTLILGVVMGGMIAAGTYFFVPTPRGAYASDCATTWEVERALDDAVDEINSHTRRQMIIWGN